MKTSKSIMLRLLLVLVAAVAFLAFACNDDEDDGDGGPEPTAGDETPVAGGDLSDIPEDTTGVTDTEIKLGTHMPLTGIAGIYGNAIVPGMQAYIDFINDTEGGVNGRKITLLVEDDAFNPSQTNSVVRKLVEQDGVFAILSGLGTAPHSAVFEYLIENKIPDLFTATGATKFTEPVTRTAFGYNPNYIEEGQALGGYIAETYPDGKLGLLIQNDDFGRDGAAGVETGLEGSNVEIISTETYEAEQTDMTSQVQRLQNAGATVVAAYALPRQAGSLVAVARQQLEWDVPIIVSGVVADQLTIALMNNGVPGTSVGVVTAAYLKPLETLNDEGIEKHKEILAQYAPDATPSNITVYGQSVAELAVEVLKRAGQDLNRRSVIEAGESVRDFTCSVCLGAINLSATDHRPIQVFQLAEVRTVDGKEAFVPFGELISYESTED